MNLSNAYILQKVDLPYFSIMYIQGMIISTGPLPF